MDQRRQVPKTGAFLCAEIHPGNNAGTDDSSEGGLVNYKIVNNKSNKDCIVE